jgi:hypothetical protein
MDIARQVDPPWTWKAGWTLTWCFSQSPSRLERNAACTCQIFLKAAQWGSMLFAKKIRPDLMSAKPHPRSWDESKKPKKKLTWRNMTV